MKVIVSLIILGLCTSAFAATPVSSSQSGSMSSTWLNSSSTKVYSAANQTDAAIWNAYALTVAGTTGVPKGQVVFGPGTTNETAYVYGYTIATNKLDKIYRRTLNATIVGWGNDTTMASVTKDETITSTTPASGFKTAVGPGYLAILSTGTDGTNEQIYLNLVSSSASEKKITTIADVKAAAVTTTTACTTTTLGLGNVWYDIGAGAFFYTYWKKVITEDLATVAGTCKGTTASTATTVWLGAHYLNGTAYLAIPGISATATSTTNTITSLVGGGDNWLNSTNIYIMYKDTTAANLYYSKTTKATTTTALGSFGSLVADDATANAAKTYTPLSVWTSNFTFGLAVGCKNQTAAAVFNYPIWNYLNSTLTKTDSGLSYTSVTDTNGGVVGLAGWMLTTGYTLVGSWTTATADTPTYIMGTFYGNGTVNATASTLASIQGPVSYFEDVNGTMWVGWTDVDTSANAMTYAGYLAKLQGQLNVAGANALSTILAFVALFLASIFAF